MTIRRPSAELLLPLLLASPLLSLGPYGVSAAELLVLLTGAYLLVTTAPLTIPGVVYGYILLFTVGRITSLVNAIPWGIPVGYERLSFLYLITLPLLAYLVGRRSERSIWEIASGRSATIILVVVGAFAAVYPFLSVGEALAVLTWFQVDGRAPTRFPGLGVNSNLYAFMAYTMFVFALAAYFRSGRGRLVAGMSALIVVSCGSRVVMVLMFGSALVLLVRAWRVGRRRHAADAVVVRRHVRRFAIAVVLVAAAAWGITSRVANDPRAQERLVAVQRVDSLLAAQVKVKDDGSRSMTEVEGRLWMWRVGLERAALAPVMGIATNIWESRDDNLVLFSTPHNEFIFYWMAYGLAGLLAHVFLLSGLIVLNLWKRAGVEWVLLYGAVIAQMTFDGAFQTVRFVALFFVIVGLNVKAWSAPDAPMEAGLA